MSLKAGGTGLNLTRANHVFHFDRWWNPAVENQATDRAFRIGQMKNVQVHKFVCAGTLEEKIDEMIERKKEVAGRVVGHGRSVAERIVERRTAGSVRAAQRRGGRVTMSPMGFLRPYFRRHRGRARPRAVSARSRSAGAFAQSWWAKRWIAVLESFNIGARLQRGRRYARRRQVLSIDIAKGAIKAKVQGSRPIALRSRNRGEAAGEDSMGKSGGGGLPARRCSRRNCWAARCRRKWRQAFRDSGV